MVGKLVQFHQIVTLVLHVVVFTHSDVTCVSVCVCVFILKYVLCVCGVAEPGRHYINNARFAFVGFRESTDEHINVGSKHRITVPAGKIGLAWDLGEPIILEPGQVYNIDKATFRYIGSKSVVEPVIVHGRLKVVTVKQGFVGISYDDGHLIILEVSECAFIHLC